MRHPFTPVCPAGRMYQARCACGSAGAGRCMRRPGRPRSTAHFMPWLVYTAACHPLVHLFGSGRRSSLELPRQMPLAALVLRCIQGFQGSDRRVRRCCCHRRPTRSLALPKLGAGAGGPSLPPRRLPCTSSARPLLLNQLPLGLLRAGLIDTSVIEDGLPCLRHHSPCGQCAGHRCRRRCCRGR